MAEDPDNKGQGDEGGKGQEPAQGGTGDEGKTKEPDQPTPDKSEDGDGGKQQPGQPFPDLETATKSYGNLLKKQQETAEELKKARASQSGEGDGDVASEVQKQLAAQREADLARAAESNTRAYFRNNPDLLKDAEMLTEMEAISNERPDLMKLEDPMAVIHALAEQRVGKGRQTAAQKEQESAERAQQNNDAKKRTAGHSHGASSKEYPTTDRVSAEEMRDMTPEQRDEYARQHQFPDE